MGKDKKKGLGFFGVVIGLILIPLSFYISYQAALRTTASDALSDAQPIAKKVDGKPFYATGKVRPRKIGDKDFLKGGADGAPVLKLERRVMVYAWYGETKGGTTSYKKKKKKYKKKKGKKKYKCKRDWVAKPKADKAYRKGCQEKKGLGPQLARRVIDAKKPKTAKITINDAASNKEYAVADFDLDSSSDSDAINAKALEPFLIGDRLVRKGDYFYDKNTCGSDADPSAIDTKKIGCNRVEFKGTMVDKNAVYTAIGGKISRDSELNRDKIEPHVKSGKSFLTVCKGTKDVCLKAVAKGDRTMTWILLGLSILAMFIGFWLMTDPLTNLIEKIPFIGGFGSGLLKVILFFVSVITMVITFVLFKYWYVVLGLFVLLIVVLVVMRKKD